MAATLSRAAADDVKDMLKVSNVLAIEPDGLGRSRLKQAFSAFRTQARVHFARGRGEALAALDGERLFESIMISSAMNFEEIHRLIEEMRALPGGSEAALVILLKGKQQEKAFVAKSFLDGICGYLCEPYSVDDLARVLQSVQETTRISEERKQQSAIAFLIDDILSRIDESAAGIARQHGPGPALQQLRSMAKVLSDMPESMHEYYYQCLIRKTEKAEVPKDAPHRKIKEEQKKAPDTEPKPARQQFRIIVKH